MALKCSTAPVWPLLGGDGRQAGSGDVHGPLCPPPPSAQPSTARREDRGGVALDLGFRGRYCESALRSQPWWCSSRPNGALNNSVLKKLRTACLRALLGLQL